MASVIHPFFVRNSASTPPGAPATGLTPTWTAFRNLSTNAAITPQPAISEIGNGQYKFTYDPVANGEAVGQIDCGAGLTNPSDRYVDVVVPLSNLAAAGYTPTRATYLDTLNNLVSNIWAAATRTLTNVGNVIVGGYATGQDPATYVLVTPANRILTDGTGHVTPTSIPNVTVGGYASGFDPASLILVTPAHKLATDVNGFVTTSSDVLGESVDGTLTLRSVLAILEAVMAGSFSSTYSQGPPPSLTTQFFRADGTTTIATARVTLDSSGHPQARTVTLSNVP